MCCLLLYSLSCDAKFMMTQHNAMEYHLKKKKKKTETADINPATVESTKCLICGFVMCLFLEGCLCLAKVEVEVEVESLSVVLGSSAGPEPRARETFPGWFWNMDKLERQES